MNAAVCHVCGSDSVELIDGYSAFHRVTSDCKPWPPGGQLAVCRECDCVQAVLCRRWRDEAKAIYADYTIYHTSHGVEQSVFDQGSGRALSRSWRLLQRALGEISLPERGRLLDVGCGNGALLRAFSELKLGWSLAGLEVNDHYRSAVESIPRVEQLYVGELDAVPDRFQLISLMHALEHIPSPTDFLSKLRSKLEPGGLLLVQVPDCEQNPFMFLVADHASHFFLPSLRRVVECAGYEVDAAANDWIPKELSVCARSAGDSASPPGSLALPGASGAIRNRLNWLARQLDVARRLAGNGRLGLFGTSIAATWLAAELGEGVRFFVDEDPYRIGASHLERPIYAPASAPEDCDVFIALPTPLAAQIKRRVEGAGFRARYHLPEPFDFK